MLPQTNCQLTWLSNRTFILAGKFQMVLKLDDFIGTAHGNIWFQQKRHFWGTLCDFPFLIFANWVWVWDICALIWIAQHGFQYLRQYLSLHWLLDYFEVILKSLLHICNPIVKCSMANQEILWTGGSKEILWGRRQAINLTSKIWYFKWFREEKN